MTSHPNRSKSPREGRNPLPVEIIAARAEAGLTQADACRLIHVTLSAWRKYESGERRMPAASWELFRIKIADKSSTAHATTVRDAATVRDAKNKP